MAKKETKRERVAMSDDEKAARKAALKAEPKTERFRRLARKRVGKAVKAIQLLVPLGRGAQYESTPEQADRIFQYLTDAVAEVKIAFAPKSRASKAAQELPDL